MEKELAGSGVQAIGFKAKELGRCGSASMARIRALTDLYAKAKAEFRTATLPEGGAKLIALSQAVPAPRG